MGCDGTSKLVDRCTYPITGAHCVNIVITDLGLFRYHKDQWVMEQIAPGFTPKEVLSLTDMNFAVSDKLRIMLAA